MYHGYISYKSILWFAKHGTNIYAISFNKNKILLSTVNKILLSKRFYCFCYCIIFVDLIYTYVFLNLQCTYIFINYYCFVACSAEFITVHTLTLQFNFYATLLTIFHAQHYSVVFNKPNKNVLAYQLVLLSFKL